MPMLEVRDEQDTLLLRYDPEAHIIELVARHYDNVKGKYCRQVRRVLLLPSGLIELLPAGAPEIPIMPMTIKAK